MCLQEYLAAAQRLTTRGADALAARPATRAQAGDSRPGRRQNLNSVSQLASCYIVQNITSKNRNWLALLEQARICISQSH